MKTGRSLHDLATELKRQIGTKRDFIVSTDAMQMEDGAELFSLHRPLDSGMRDVEPFGMTDLFHRQLGTALGIPSKYYDKMRTEYPDLLTQNIRVNCFLNLRGLLKIEYVFVWCSIVGLHVKKHKTHSH